MQTDRGIYHKRVCDRCGAVLGGRMMNPDEYFKNWAWRRDTGDQSEHVADFVWDERGCKEWEKKDEL